MIATDFIKKVGKGKTLSKSLTQEEAGLAMSTLLNNGFTQSQFGAFLQALRIKELSQEELNGFTEICFKNQEKKMTLEADFVLNLSSDTPRKGGVLSILALGLLIKKGLKPIVVHSNPILSNNHESFNHSLELLKGIFPDEYEILILRIFHSEELIPNWRSFNTVRKELGFRSFLHTLEKMLTPYKKAPMLIGISHKAYAERMLKTLAELGVESNIVLGNHGVIDFLFHKPTTVMSFEKSEVVERTISLESLKLELPTSLYSLSQFSLWQGFLQEPKHCLWDAIRFQAAAILTITSKDASIESHWDEINF